MNEGQNEIGAVLIDRREPEWVQRLSFGGALVSVTELEYGDLHVLCSDGMLLVIERKTPDDFLGSLRDERLLPQMVGLANLRLDGQIKGEISTWPYLLITGELQNGLNGKAVCSPGRGQTAWDWSAVQGALLTIQEMGIFTAHCAGDSDLEACILRLAKRKRDALHILPARPAQSLGVGAAFIAGLPGIGVERSLDVMRWANGNVAHALMGLTDVDMKAPVGQATRRKIRMVMGLRDGQELGLDVNSQHQEVLRIY